MEKLSRFLQDCASSSVFYERLSPLAEKHNIQLVAWKMDVVELPPWITSSSSSHRCWMLSNFLPSRKTMCHEPAFSKQRCRINISWLNNKLTMNSRWTDGLDPKSSQKACFKFFNLHCAQAWDCRHWNIALPNVIPRWCKFELLLHFHSTSKYGWGGTH